MRAPSGGPQPPEHLRTRYADWNWQLAWRNGPDALTYRLSGAHGEVHFLKLAPAHSHPSLHDEAERTVWAASHLPVPQVLEIGSHESRAWLVTVALPGVDATAPELKSRPETLVPILARALRLFHRAPVAECPFDFRVPAALAHVRGRLERGLIDADRDFHSEHAQLSPVEAVDRLAQWRPTTEDLVVCHGDYCLPNVLIEAGGARGFVDLGELGVADRWWDLAVATWSVTWNLGPGYEDLFLREYGAEPDPDRIRFYRLLYDLTS